MKKKERNHWAEIINTPNFEDYGTLPVKTPRTWDKEGVGGKTMSKEEIEWIDSVRYEGKTIIANCQFCNEEFRQTPKSIHQARKTCSDKCRDERRKKLLKEKYLTKGKE